MPASQPAPGELPYQEITDDSYASQAAPTFTVEESRPGDRVLRGRCPRCQAIIEIPVMPSAFTGMRSLSDLFRGGTRRVRPTASSPSCAPAIMAIPAGLRVGKDAARTGTSRSARNPGELPDRRGSASRAG